MIYIPPHIICRCLMIYTPLNILRGVIHIPLYSVRLFLCTLCFSASWTTSLNTVSVSSAAQYSSVPHYLHPSIQYPLVFLCTEFVSAPLSASLNTVSVCFSAQYSSVPHYLHPSIQYPSDFSSSSVYLLNLYKLSADASTLSACQFSSENNNYYSVGWFSCGFSKQCVSQNVSFASSPCFFWFFFFSSTSRPSLQVPLTVHAETHSVM